LLILVFVWLVVGDKIHYAQELKNSKDYF
jgi:hypothetical protein